MKVLQCLLNFNTQPNRPLHPWGRSLGNKWISGAEECIVEMIIGVENEMCIHPGEAACRKPTVFVKYYSIRSILSGAS
jgi:hypothetical protein